MLVNNNNTAQAAILLVSVHAQFNGRRVVHHVG